MSAATPLPVQDQRANERLMGILLYPVLFRNDAADESTVKVFPADAPGVYYNESRLGLVCARLRGDYGVTRDDRVDLEFKNLVLKIGPFQAAEKVFAEGQMRGYWKFSFCDDDFRVFTTNMGNLFVLRRV